MAIMTHNINQKPGYKQTELGVIPEDWEPTPLGLLSAFITKGATPTTYGFSWVNDGVLFLRSECVSEQGLDLTQSMFITSEAHNILKRGEIRAGDILITITGNVGRVIYLNPDFGIANINQHIARVRIVDSNVATDYVYHFLSQAMIRKYYNSIVTGQAYPQISLKQVRDTRVPIPPTKSEQTAIATALSDTDSLITSLDHLITKKRDIKQATMQLLLTGKVRLPGFSKKLKPTYRRTEVGIIPEDWEVRSIGDVITDFRGGAPLTPSDFTRDGVKVLPKGGVARGGRLKIAENEQQYCSQKYAEAHKSNQVNNLYTIVVLRDLVPSGPSIGLMVKIEDPDGFVLAQGVYGFKVCQDKIDPEYLVQTSNGFDYRKLMNSIMVGSTQVHITNTALKKVLLPFPSLPEQQAIATALSDMDAEIAVLEQKREKTHMLKQGMMQELLTGKTRLI